ncbi:MAG TPA: cell division protein SepF [Acidimicrobiales bacterium]|nr:cell division protein SepF [Acidimicrobiales bacterium]
MATFIDKALTYLGLKDVEDEELYAGEYEDVADHAAQRFASTVYPEGDYDEPVERSSHASTLRPLVTATREPVTATQTAVVRPLVPSRPSAAKVHVVAPARFPDAQEIGDLVKQSHPVIVNLQLSERDLSRRMIDFCSGLTYALGGSMERVADQVFLLTPSNVEVSPEERMRLQERGLFRS